MRSTRYKVQKTIKRTSGSTGEILVKGDKAQAQRIPIYIPLQSTGDSLKKNEERSVMLGLSSLDKIVNWNG